MLAAETKAAEAAHLPASHEPSHGTWKHIVEPVEPFLRAVADGLEEQVQAFDPGIATYARYALTNQGKQLRPALVALSANAAGGVNPRHVTVAVVIEMVHLATLVHDDVMDEAAIRRQRPTLAANWGSHISVLLGDCLFAHALKLAASFPTPEICRAVAAASNTVCTGEILQTNGRLNFSLRREDYFRVLSMKTAEFFALACELGGRLSGAPDAECEGLRRYGMALGLAYQLYDDCLDLFGSEAVVGKSLGTDLASGKLTLPVLIALERASADEQARLKQWIRGWQPEHHPHVLALLERHGVLPLCRAEINLHVADARRALEALPASDSRGALERLTHFLVQQCDDLGQGG
jgi:octaprenyl-diphosphate synthase